MHLFYIGDCKNKQQLEHYIALSGLTAFYKPLKHFFIYYEKGKRIMKCYVTFSEEYFYTLMS